MATRALDALKNAKAILLAEANGRIAALKRSVEAEAKKQVGLVAAAAKAQIGDLAKRAIGALLKSLMAGASTSMPSEAERMLTQRLAASIAKDLRPLVEKGIKAAATASGGLVKSLMGGATLSADAVCKAVSAAAAAATAGIGLAVGPVCVGAHDEARRSGPT